MPPYFNNLEISIGLEDFNFNDISLIDLDISSYSFLSLKFSFTGLIITFGSVNLPSSTASLIIYFLTGGISAIILEYLGSLSSIVAVRPKIALLESSSKIEKILLNFLAVEETR